MWDPNSAKVNRKNGRVNIYRTNITSLILIFGGVY